ncbi:MAG: hypothetical protein L3K02_07020, partial [Thermoplasmata archaeon]|nr:hypothetical protein [Thermoplasmata archaeon]
MTASSISGVGEPSVLEWGPLSHVSHRVVLPLLSGLSFLLVCVLLFWGPQALGRYVFLAFFALGAGTLGCSLAYLRRRRWALAEGTLRTAPTPPDRPTSVCPQCSGTAPPSLEWEDLFYGRFDVAPRAGGTAGSLRVMFTPTSAADQLWVHWLPTEVGELPSELIAPIPESAYYPPEPGVEPDPSSADPALTPVYDVPELGGAVLWDSPTRPGDAGAMVAPSPTEAVRTAR